MSSETSIDKSISQITERYRSCFRPNLGPIRKVGREAEFPVVDAEGLAGDVSALWEPLLAEPGFAPYYDDPQTRALLVGVERGNLNIAAEVGRGTIELSIGPFEDLWQLQKEFYQAVGLVARVAESRGLYLLGFGIQPRTRPSPSLITPRPRYDALYRAIGAPWLHLATTAADQTHVDISRSELLDAINWMNLLSAPIIALCANSSVYAGRVGQYVSGREGLLRGLGEFRYGMTPKRFETLKEWIRYLCDYECFVLPDGSGFRQIKRPFTSYLRRHPKASFDQFLWHEHYVWNSARARVRTSTIEVRPACQQPPAESLAANALILGLVESLPQVAQYMTGLLRPDPWPPMIKYRKQVIRQGLGAAEPVFGFLRGLVVLANAGLARRGRGEERFLAPIWRRMDQRASPAKQAREIVERHGIGALVQAARI